MTRRLRYRRRRFPRCSPAVTSWESQRRAAGRPRPSRYPRWSTRWTSERCAGATGPSSWCWRPCESSPRKSYPSFGASPRRTRACDASACWAVGARRTTSGSYATARRSSWARRGGWWTCAGADTSRLRIYGGSRIWCWTRRTGCWTWGSRRRSGRYATGAGRIDKLRCSRRRCRRACERCATTSWEATR